MSVISLDTVIAFKASEKPKEIVLGNVDMFGKSAPDNGVTFYYGFQESLTEQSLAAQELNKKGNQTSSVIVSVDIGESNQKATTPEFLPQTRFLNMANMTKALEMDVQRVWKDILKNEGIDQNLVDDKDYWKNKQFLLKNPQLVGKLRDYEQFAHLDVIGYPFSNPGVKSFCKRATLFSNEHVKEIRVLSYPEIEVSLPDLSVKKQATFKP
ncbi:MAG: hypothetical protein CTY35_00445 [Methylotenera sp.]|uniref:hypothetical protein n=1 Tax=Methylotenera sp. TaxID=2051956 RepID=UPI000D4718BA|nr:hypothetical protein [Methylotenera sp.]PPC84824.1 MAG: hypothetical protein CTY38_00440 [Methylotenera sp.]PPD02184.1 MAG: hypothetical protein CTY35_00445 [Methylotenera sp.]